MWPPVTSSAALRGRNVVATVYSAAVVVAKSVRSRDAGSLPSVLGATCAALKRMTPGAAPRDVSTARRALVRAVVSLTSAGVGGDDEVGVGGCEGGLGGVEIGLCARDESDVCEALGGEVEGCVQGDARAGADDE